MSLHYMLRDRILLKDRLRYVKDACWNPRASTDIQKYCNLFNNRDKINHKILLNYLKTRQYKTKQGAKNR